MRILTRWGRIAALAAIIAAGTISTAAAQAEKPKIALYIANDKLKPEEKNVLTRKFLSPFTASGLYSIIDRSDIFTQKANQERIKQRDGSVNEKEIYKIGYEAGAKYVCMVELDYAFGRWNVAARMVNVVTAEIYLTQGETDIAGELDKADISGAAKTIFNQIHGRSGGSAAPTPTPPPAPPKPKPQIAVDEHGMFTDTRDGKKYKTVVIGEKRWMAANLNYKPQTGNSWCYDNNNSNCDKYGRLYDWNAAFTACPAGWHVSSHEEWRELAVTAGDSLAAGKTSNSIAGTGGKRLKAGSGWRGNGNGTDDYGFSALPGGLLRSQKFEGIGDNGNWWSYGKASSVVAVSHSMNYDKDIVGSSVSGVLMGISVRCVADN